MFITFNLEEGRACVPSRPTFAVSFIGVFIAPADIPILLADLCMAETASHALNEVPRFRSHSFVLVSVRLTAIRRRLATTA